MAVGVVWGVLVGEAVGRGVKTEAERREVGVERGAAGRRRS